MNRLQSAQSVGSSSLGLVCLLLLEIGIFSIVGTNFCSTANALEIGRLCVEIGLLALALTPVIITGGIDLSVGSLLGLCAVLLGKLWRDAGWPIGAAAGAAIAAGAVGGALNALVITRLRVPPLVVTLGSYSLFRGLAEGLTGGVDNFTRFPDTFLFLGQGYWFDFLPAQLPLFVLWIVALWMLVHATVLGRAWSAIGYSADGARYAGIRVERSTALAYLICGLAAGTAAVVYVSHVGQAKADAGTNYELAAITAVVLGGTSIFGGRGSITGTLLGLLAIAVLQNGIRLADQPAEAAGALNAVLLLAAIIFDTHRGLVARLQSRPQISDSASESEEFSMKNTQLAVLCSVILIAAGIMAASNWQLARAVRDTVSAQPRMATGSSATAPGPSQVKPLTIAMMPKSKGNAYFIACKRGADEAAAELGVNLIWDGPTDTDPAKQNEVVETWITRQVDVIAVAVENREGLASVLRKARQRGISVVTWDADTEPDARDFFVNQATPEGIGHTLMDEAARVLGEKGEFAVITASLTAGNQNEWRKHIEARLAEKYPGMRLAVVRPCDDQQKKAFEVTQTILNAEPGVKLIMAICSPAVPGAAEAVKQSGRNDVKVIGLGLPNDNKRFVHAGITETVILWNTMDLGYLTIHAACALRNKQLQTGATQFTAGRLGSLQIVDDNILLGQPFKFDKSNIDQFDF
ncbi:MAG: substrate-binding domain-containing protein [Planctomycetes bacterium]|nr:substrate-binding domain-containing protein [Planctomycetota bacterium]